MIQGQVTFQTGSAAVLQVLAPPPPPSPVPLAPASTPSLLESINPTPPSGGALAAVKGIKKQHLVEVRSLNNPPEVVKVALESICTLLGERDVDWRSMRQIIMRDNFIPSIVNFDTEKMS